MVKSRANASSCRVRGLMADTLRERRTSTFKDRRFGSDLKLEKLVKLRQRQARKTFNLGSEEALMHGGRPLSTLADNELQDNMESGDDEPLDPHADDPVLAGKMRKEERAMAKDAHINQRSQLDSELNDIMSELQFRPPKAFLPKENADDYDRLALQLGTEKRAVATERTKSPEEIAQEKLEQLEVLERDRVARLRGDTGLDMALGDGEGADDAVSDKESDHPSGGADECVDDEGESSEEDESEDQEEALAETEVVVTSVEVDDQPVTFLSAQEISEIDFATNTKDEDNLPFAMECPGTGGALAKLLRGCSAPSSVKLIQRIRTRTTVTLAEGNRAKLQTLFVLLLDHIIKKTCSDNGDISASGLELLYALKPTLLEFAGSFPEEATSFFAAKLQTMKPGDPPRAGQLCCLKLITMLFPTTDFQHPITSPAAVLADYWASVLAKFGSGLDNLVSEAVMLCGILRDFIVPARRFCASFFQLCTAVLESCGSPTTQKLELYSGAAASVDALLSKSLRELSDASGAAALLVARSLVRPSIDRLRKESANFGQATLTALAELEDIGRRDATVFAPLKLFETGPPQIRTLEPIFHEAGDMPSGRLKGERTETQRLKQKLNEERRSTARQLRRDASALQLLQGRQNEKLSAGRKLERKRVARIMDQETSMLKQMKMEHVKFERTTFGRTKEERSSKRRGQENDKPAKATDQKEEDKVKGQGKRDKSPEVPKKTAKPSGKKKKKLKGR